MEKICPFCSETIKETAIKCKHCGEFLDGIKSIDDVKRKTSTSSLWIFQLIGLFIGVPMFWISIWSIVTLFSLAKRFRRRLTKASFGSINTTLSHSGFVLSSFVVQSPRLAPPSITLYSLVGGEDNKSISPLISISGFVTKHDSIRIFDNLDRKQPALNCIPPGRIPRMKFSHLLSI